MGYDGGVSANPRPPYAPVHTPGKSGNSGRYRGNSRRSRRRVWPVILMALGGFLLLAVGLALTITAVGVHFFGQRVEVPQAAAPPLGPQIDLSDFQAGNLISDAVFYDYNSMDLSAIETFIREKNAGCQGETTVCLADYQEDTVDIPPSPRCRGYQGAPGESAAAIIYQTAQACRINPQVLLVLIQKEQGLLTASGSDLTPSRYDIAAGFGCPDGANCDPQYFGFGTQVYYAAAQFQRYRQNPAQFQFRAGQMNSIPFAPNGSCGAASVYLENQATAALYNYTPYQPDSEVLAGTPGQCSSYGNANFFGIFKAWFGNPRK
ncbi:hemagglutinin [Mobiluncus porci]|nr:hemagglutinin [Mobiluncus porci]